MVVLSKILPLIVAGVGLFFLVNAITRPAHAQQTAGAISDTLSAFGRGGAAVGEVGQGIGEGLAGLFKPVWEVSNLVERFSSLASGSANVGPVAQETAGGGAAVGESAGDKTRSSSTITWNSGTTATVPSLSPAARSFYRTRGVSVT